MKKKRKKKDEKTLLPSLFESEIKEKERACAFLLSEKCSSLLLVNTLSTFYPLSVPTTHTTHIPYDTRETNSLLQNKNMTDSKRSNAAGEKYALRGIYGSEPYWPQEKLKICVTGAGGFIGETYYRE